MSIINLLKLLAIKFSQYDGCIYPDEKNKNLLHSIENALKKLVAGFTKVQDAERAATAFLPPWKELCLQESKRDDFNPNSVILKLCPIMHYLSRWESDKLQKEVIENIP